MTTLSAGALLRLRLQPTDPTTISSLPRTAQRWTGGMLVLNVNATAPAVTITPNPVRFADQAVETTSAVQTVTYRNNGTVNIGVSSVSIAGANSNDFIIESQGCAG